MVDLLYNNRFKGKLMLAMPDQGDGGEDDEEDDKITEPTADNR